MLYMVKSGSSTITAKSTLRKGPECAVQIPIKYDEIEGSNEL